MAFDPDAFLGPSKSTDFNPDSFLQEETKAPAYASAVPEVRNGEVVRPPKYEDKRTTRQKFTDFDEGLKETVLALGSGIPLGLAGAWKGLITGDGEKSAQEMGQYAYQPKTEAGQEMTSKASELLNYFANPLIGPMTGNLGAMRRPGKAPKVTPAERPVAEILKPAEVKFNPDEFLGAGGKEDIINKPLSPEEQFWKDRATKMTAEARAKELPPEVLRAQQREPHLAQQEPIVGTPEQMEGLSRSTEGVSFENLPPDAVVPRSAPTKGLEAPRMGQWKVDEHGMPVREGFAPETRLGPPMDLPLNQSAHDLGNAIQEANGPKLGQQDVYGSGRLEGPMGAPEPLAPPSKVINSPGNRQGGRINLDIYDPRYDVNKKLDERYQLRFRGPGGRERPEPTVFLIDKNAEGGPKVVGSVLWGRDKWAQKPDMEHNLEALMTQVDPSHQRKGLAEAMYRFANEQGNDIVPSEGKQTPEGKAMWAGFEKRGYTGKIESMNRGMSRGQGGGLDIQGISDALASLRSKWSGSKEISPEEVITREQIRAKAKVLSNVIGNKLPEYLDPVSAEEAASMAINAKDIKSNPATNRLASGVNFMATYHNNPLLKYARRVMSDANAEATAFKNDHQVGPQGFVPAANKMSKADKLRFSELWQHLDKEGIEYTDAIGDQVGLSPEAKAASEAWNKASKASWEWAGKNAEAQGVSQGPYRPGYTPSMYDGSYMAIVTKGDRIVGTISADTPGEFFKAKKYYEGKHEGAKFSAETPSDARIKIGGAEASSWKFRDLGSVINLLTKEDNSFSTLQQELNKSALKEATNFRGFDYHNLVKTGIEGAMGDKGWLSAERNAQDRVNSMNRYIGEAADYHSMQLPMQELTTTMAGDAFSHMPNAREYLGTYLKNAKGQYTNDLGHIANAAFNLASKLPEAVGVGPRQILKVSNAIKNNLSQMYMAWYNVPFMLSQLIQPVQTGMPLGFMVARRLGLNEMDFANSMSKGYVNFLKYDLDRLGLMKMDADTRYATQWARDRGLMSFTEAEKAYSGEKGKLARAKDKVADVTMELGEHASRAPMFFTFYDLVKKAEPNREVALQVAEHLTNQAMGNYGRNERPLVYSGMGVMGPHTGALTTFKHNYIGTQAILAQEVKKTGNIKPIAASAAVAIGLAGLTGVAAYDEMDSIYQHLRGLATGEKRSIRQDFMQMLPEMAKTGVISDVLGLNVQGKFSSAQMVAGGDIGKAIAPYASGAYDIAHDVGKAAIDPSKANLAQAAVTLSPASTRQAVKSAVQRDSEGYLLNRQGQRDVQRTPEEWKRSSITGLTPLHEAVERQNLFQNRKNEKFRMEQMKAASDKFKEGIIDGDTKKQQEAINEYEKLGGNVGALLRGQGQIIRESEMSSQERAEGLPRSRGGATRYEGYQTRP